MLVRLHSIPRAHKVDGVCVFSSSRRGRELGGEAEVLGGKLVPTKRAGSAKMQQNNSLMEVRVKVNVKFMERESE